MEKNKLILVVLGIILAGGIIGLVINHHLGEEPTPVPIPYNDDPVFDPVDEEIVDDKFIEGEVVDIINRTLIVIGQDEISDVSIIEGALITLFLFPEEEEMIPSEPERIQFEDIEKGDEVVILYDEIIPIGEMVGSVVEVFRFPHF